MDFYLGAICTFGFNFAPVGWAQCNGQLLSISEYSALYALLGTTFGGDGVTTFGVPDLRSRVPIGTGQGPGLSSYVLGQKAGAESANLSVNNLAAHTHVATTSIPVGTTSDTTNPTGKYFGGAQNTQYASTGGNPMGTPTGQATSSSGGSIPFDIHNPLQGVNYCIATAGVWPTHP